MEKPIKSGKKVIDEFFDEILNVEGTDEGLVNKLIELYGENKFTDSNIKNALEELKQEAIKQKKIKDDGEN